MARRSYGRVRKKSNQIAEDAEARSPATRVPRMEMAAIRATRMRAAAVPTSDALAGTRTAVTPSGAANPQILATPDFLAAAPLSARVDRSRNLPVMGASIGLTCQFYALEPDSRS